MKNVRSILGVFAFALAIAAAVAGNARTDAFTSAWGNDPLGTLNNCTSGTIIDEVACGTSVTMHGFCTVQFADAQTADAKHVSNCTGALYRQQ